MIQGKNPFGHHPLQFALLFLFTGLVLSACGFHLRGSVELPESLNSVALTGTDRNSELGLGIRDAFNRSGSRVEDSPAQARSVLVILEDKTERRVLSVDGLGRASAYTLNYTLSFRLDTADGKPWIPRQSITLQRQYRFNPDTILAKGDQELRFYNEMRRDAIDQMMRRLQAGVQHAPEDKASAPAS